MRSIPANSTCPIEFARLLLERSVDEEKQSQLQRLADFHAPHARESPAMLQQAVMEDRNVFEVAEIGAWLRASWCQMPTNRRGAIPQSLLAAFQVRVASLFTLGTSLPQEPAFEISSQLLWTGLIET